MKEIDSLLCVYISFITFIFSKYGYVIELKYVVSEWVCILKIYMQGT